MATKRKATAARPAADNGHSQTATPVADNGESWPGILIGEEMTLKALRPHVVAWQRQFIRLEGIGCNLGPKLHDLWNYARRIDGVPPPPPLPAALAVVHGNDQAAFQAALAALDSLLRWCDEAERPAAVAAVPDSAKMSPNDLAHKHGVSLGPFRKRLDRWRYDHDTGYAEVANAKRNEPRFLYDESAVMPVIEALKAKSVGQKRATDGQQKKI